MQQQEGPFQFKLDESLVDPVSTPATLVQTPPPQCRHFCSRFGKNTHTHTHSAVTSLNNKASLCLAHAVVVGTKV